MNLPWKLFKTDMVLLPRLALQLYYLRRDAVLIFK